MINEKLQKNPWFDSVQLIICSIPAFTLSFILVDAIYKMKGDANTKYSLNKGQIALQIVTNFALAIATITYVFTNKKRNSW